MPEYPELTIEKALTFCKNIEQLENFIFALFHQSLAGKNYHYGGALDPRNAVGLVMRSGLVGDYTASKEFVERVGRVIWD